MSDLAPICTHPLQFSGMPVVMRLLLCTCDGVCVELAMYAHFILFSKYLAAIGESKGLTVRSLREL